MYNPSGSQLQTGSRKIQCHFVGPPCNLQMHKPQPILTHVSGWSTLPYGSRKKPGLNQAWFPLTKVQLEI